MSLTTQQYSDRTREILVKFQPLIQNIIFTDNKLEGDLQFHINNYNEKPSGVEWDLSVQKHQYTELLTYGDVIESATLIFPALSSLVIMPPEEITVSTPCSLSSLCVSVSSVYYGQSWINQWSITPSTSAAIEQYKKWGGVEPGETFQQAYGSGEIMLVCKSGIIDGTFWWEMWGMTSTNLLTALTCPVGLTYIQKNVSLGYTETMTVSEGPCIPLTPTPTPTTTQTPTVTPTTCWMTSASYIQRQKDFLTAFLPYNLFTNVIFAKDCNMSYTANYYCNSRSIVSDPIWLNTLQGKAYTDMMTNWGDIIQSINICIVLPNTSTQTPTPTPTPTKNPGLTNTPTPSNTKAKITPTPTKTPTKTVVPHSSTCITTHAGYSRLIPGSSINGPALSATFNKPRDIAIDSIGNMFICDTGYHQIRKIDFTGVVTTFAGTGIIGNLDGPGASAKFSGPMGIVCDSSDNLYVADTGNNRIRKITPAGVVSTYAAIATVTAGIKYQRGIAIDSSNNLYIADAGIHKIFKISSGGVVSTLAGSGAANMADGVGNKAAFKNPSDLVLDSAGNIYVADTGNNRIRKITPAGIVTTFAGSSSGFSDGVAAVAKFYMPTGIAIDGANNLYVADLGNHRVRKITPAGIVSTVVGTSVVNSVTSKDGPVDIATILNPSNIVIGNLGTIYVTDITGLGSVRKIAQCDGSIVVTTPPAPTRTATKTPTPTPGRSSTPTPTPTSTRVWGSTVSLPISGTFSKTLSSAASYGILVESKSPISVDFSPYLPLHPGRAPSTGWKVNLFSVQLKQTVGTIQASSVYSSKLFGVTINGKKSILDFKSIIPWCGLNPFRPTFFDALLMLQPPGLYYIIF